jgi:hypothetical protein
MKRFSLGFAGFYLALGIFGGGECFFQVMLFLVLPMFCIWFPEEVGGFTGRMRMRHINSTSPACLVSFMGWLFLVLPMLLGVLASGTA